MENCENFRGFGFIYIYIDYINDHNPLYFHEPTIMSSKNKFIKLYGN